MTPVEQLLRDLVGLLEEDNLPYALMGGIAVRAHGLPRPTYDVDVTIGIDRDDLPDLFRQIDELGYEVGDQFRGLARLGRRHAAVQGVCLCGRAVVADIFVAENEFQVSILDRRVREHLDDLSAWFVSAEDLILLKLVADRYRDRGDVQDVFTMQPKLDDAHLDHWAGKLGVADKLADARREFAG